MTPEEIKIRDILASYHWASKSRTLEKWIEEFPSILKARDLHTFEEYLFGGLQFSTLRQTAIAFYECTFIAKHLKNAESAVELKLPLSEVLARNLQAELRAFNPVQGTPYLKIKEIGQYTVAWKEYAISFSNEKWQVDELTSQGYKSTCATNYFDSFSDVISFILTL